MSKVVLDTSALLALINNETGKDRVIEILPSSIMSSVNVAEAASILMARFNMPKEVVQSIIQKLIENIVSFTSEQAYIAGELNIINMEKKLNLSLGDRACLALAKDLQIPVYTADKPWKELKLDNIDIRFIR
jgi:PIN domain nuclease of toxin-antitoxin system